MLFWYLENSPGKKFGRTFRKGERSADSGWNNCWVLLGIAATLYILSKDTIGNLVIADDPEDGPYMFLEISRLDIKRLRLQPTVKLNVVNKGKTHK